MGLPAPADLALGAPAGSEATVCLVRVVAGPPRAEHRQQLHVCALLQTLRSGAPPFRVATWYSATGPSDADAVDETLLRHAEHSTVADAVLCCRLPARTTPRDICGNPRGPGALRASAGAEDRRIVRTREMRPGA